MTVNRNSKKDDNNKAPRNIQFNELVEEPLHSALNRFSNYLVNSNLIDITNRNISSYKNWHREDFNTFEKNLGYEIKIENIFISLHKLYSQIDPNLILNSSYRFLKYILDNKPNIGRKGIPSNKIIEDLSKILHKAESNYVFSKISTPKFTNTSQSNDTNLTSDNSQSSNVQNQSQNLIVNDTVIQQTNENNIEPNDNHIVDNQTENTPNADKSAHDGDESLVDVEKNATLERNKIFKKIKNSMRRIFIKENDIKLLKFHLTNGTTPNQLVFSNFPLPFLHHNDNFVTKYNDLISSFQTNAMDLSISCLEENIKDLKNNIIELKSQLSDFDNLDSMLKLTEKNLIKELKKQFDSAHEKALRIIARPYTVKQNNTINHSNNDTTQDQSNVKSDKVNSKNSHTPVTSKSSSRQFSKSNSNENLPTSSKDRLRSMSNTRLSSSSHYYSKLRQHSQSRNYSRARQHSHFRQYSHPHWINYSNSKPNFKSSNYSQQGFNPRLRVNNFYYNQNSYYRKFNNRNFESYYNHNRPQESFYSKSFNNMNYRNSNQFSMKNIYSNRFNINYQQQNSNHRRFNSYEIHSNNNTNIDSRVNRQQSLMRAESNQNFRKKHSLPIRY